MTKGGIIDNHLGLDDAPRRHGRRKLRVAGGRKKFGNALEAFLQSDPLLRATTDRYLGKPVKLGTDRVVAVLKTMQAVLA